MNLPKYGQTVTATKGLKRKWESRQRGCVQQGYKVWVETDEHIEGIFLGTRTLQNGWIRFEDDSGCIFQCNYAFKVALVSPGARLNPVYVPLNNIKKVS